MIDGELARLDTEPLYCASLSIPVPFEAGVHNRYPTGASNLNSVLGRCTCKPLELFGECSNKNALSCYSPNRK